MVETKPLPLTHHLANVLLQSASHLKLPEKLITGINIIVGWTKLLHVHVVTAGLKFYNKKIKPSKAMQIIL